MFESEFDNCLQVFKFVATVIIFSVLDFECVTFFLLFEENFYCVDVYEFAVAAALFETCHRFFDGVKDGWFKKITRDDCVIRVDFSWTWFFDDVVDFQETGFALGTGGVTIAFVVFRFA